METILFFIAVELAVSSSLVAVQQKMRYQIFQKWREGSLTIEELKRLKQMRWFRKIWNPTKQKVPFHKKND
jgi:hypothetical protein